MRRIPVFDKDDVFQQAVKRVWENGYVTVVDDHWEPTYLGWRCLIAEADAPISKPQPKRKEAA